jgi:hypothetical protein
MIRWLKDLQGASDCSSIMMMMTIISMGWDYISELRPPSGLLFIPQVVYDYREPWWNDIDRVNANSFHRAHWQSCRQSSSSNAGGTGEGNGEFCLKKCLFHTSKDYSTCRKDLRHGAEGFTSPPKESVLRIFIALKNPSFSAGFESAYVGFNGKHATTRSPRTTCLSIIKTVLRV